MPVPTEIVLRPITEKDNAELANLIRQVMPEFGASGDGFAIVDPEVDCMYQTYNQPRHSYLVYEENGRIVGGGGIGSLVGGEADICDLAVL